MVRDKIAIDLGGTNLRVALIRSNKIKKYIKKKTPESKKEILKELVNSIKELMHKNVSGIGIAVAGMVQNGVVKKTPNLPLDNFNLKGFIQEKFRKKTVIENDANCAALAEAKLGCRKKNFIILTLGTGIGGGIIVNNELYRGQGYAGELGHILLDNGEDFENLTGGKAIRKVSEKYCGKTCSVSELTKMNTPSSRKVLQETSKYFGQGIASLINAFDPEIVVLAGGIRETGKPFLNMIKNEVKKYLFIPRNTDIKWSKLDHPGTLGAGLLIK